MKREKAVTRKDLDDLQDPLVTRMRADLDERIKTKLDTAVFESRMSEIARDIRLLQIDAVDKGARMDALSRTVTEKLNGAVDRMETLWRETVTFPRVP